MNQFFVVAFALLGVAFATESTDSQAVSSDDSDGKASVVEAKISYDDYEAHDGFGLG